MCARSSRGRASRRLVASDTNGHMHPACCCSREKAHLLRQGFDADRLTVTDQATSSLNQIARNLEYGLAAFSVSANGVLTFRSAADAASQFAWFDRAGRLLETVGPPGNYRMPALSPDEKRLAYMDVDGRDIWILDMAQDIFQVHLDAGSGEVSGVVAGWHENLSTVESGRRGRFREECERIAPEQLYFKGRVKARRRSLRRQGDSVFCQAHRARGPGYLRCADNR